MKDNNHYKNVGVVLLVLLSLAYYFEIKYMFYGVVIFGALLFSFEKLAILFSKYWMLFGKFLGDINSRIILSVFFLLILLPVALLKRLFSGKIEAGKSTWVEQENVVEDFTKPW